MRSAVSRSSPQSGFGITRPAGSGSLAQLQSGRGDDLLSQTKSGPKRDYRDDT
jgi:hypothetical protein